MYFQAILPVSKIHQKQVLPMSYTALRLHPNLDHVHVYLWALKKTDLRYFGQEINNWKKNTSACQTCIRIGIYEQLHMKKLAYFGKIKYQNAFKQNHIGRIDRNFIFIIATKQMKYFKLLHIVVFGAYSELVL